MELRQLKYFLLVSRLGSITKAAEQSHIAQPAMSISIQKLEEELGVRLFDRGQRKLLLTDAGHIFLQRAESIISQVQNAVIEMEDYQESKRGAMKIGIPAMLGAFLFPYVFNKFQQDHPYLELTIIEEGTLTITTLLEQGELDVGIIPATTISPRLETANITTGELCVCLPLNHPLSKLTRIPFRELRNQQFILFKEDTYSRQLIIEECTKHRFAPRIVFSSSQIETVLGLVEQGVGISFLFGLIAQKHRNIVSRPLTAPIFIQAGIAWNKNRYLSNAAQAFINAIRKYPFNED